MPKYYVLFLLFFYTTLTGVISIFLGQDINWDLQNYHLYNPYQFLENRFKFDVMPAQIQTFYSPILDIPFYLALYKLKLPPIFIGFILGWLQGLNLFFLHLIGLTVLPKKLFYQCFTFIAVLCGAGGVIFYSQIGTVFGDSTTSLFILCAIYLISAKLESSCLPTMHLAIAGLAIGIGTGLKYTNIIHAISIFLAINCFWSKNRLKNNFYLLLPALIGFLTCAGYWMYLLWQEFGNPVLPFLNNIFKSPYLDTVAFKDVRFNPKTWGQFFFYPFYFLDSQHLPWEMPFRDARMAVGMSLGWIFLLLISFPKDYFQSRIFKPISINLKFIISYFLICYLVWVIVFCYYRYIIPLELLSPILVLAFFSILNLRTAFNAILLTIIFTSIVAWTQIPTWGRKDWSSDWLEIDPASLAKYENSIIVFWYKEPTSFIIPSFPKSTRFVRIHSNHLLTKESLLYQSAKKIIAEHYPGEIYLLNLDAPADKKLSLLSDLPDFNLSTKFLNCEPLATKIQTFQLCPLTYNLNH